jgi:hypothetical protein
MSTNHPKQCPECVHFRADAKWPRAIGYGRCECRPAVEGKVAHFVSVNRAFYGLCSKGQFFQPLKKEVTV